MSAKNAKGEAHPRAYHPLFPVPVDAQDIDLANRDISVIYIFRNGEVAPKKWLASEITDEEQILEQYGGGQYTLKARDESKARWTASRELRLPGPSKPLHDALPAPAAPPMAPTPTVEISSPGVRDALAVAAVIGPLVLQWADASARRSEAQTNLLMTILGKQNQGPNDQVMNVLLQSAIQRNPSAEHFAMVQNALQMGMQMGARQGQGGEDDVNDLLDQFNAGMGNLVELEKAKAERAKHQAAPKPVVVDEKQ